MQRTAAAALLPLVSAVPSPSRFHDYLNENVSPGGLPLSYMVSPSNYFDQIPASSRVPPGGGGKAAKVAVPCEGKMVAAAQWDEYTFQSEKMITNGGLNIYDGAVWCIAQALLGTPNTARNYINGKLIPHHTQQLQDIRGDKPCVGDIFTHQCTDSNETGACGFCYGDTGAKSQDKDHAYFFRTISDVYGFEGTKDARCPEKNAVWTWNDWKPILGENAWASLIGALGTAYVAYGRNAAAIPDNCNEMTLAANFIPTLMAMRVQGAPGTPVYYAPRNTYFFGNPDAGSTVSTENQASLLAGLKSFKYVLEQKGSSSSHYGLLGNVNSLISGIEKYFESAWTGSYFRQGGSMSGGAWAWHQGDSPEFAVDCQTWSSSVLGSTWIDAHFGKEAALKLWGTLKSKAGYGASGGMVKGVGYTENSYAGEVFSGEWTFGAINWLRIMAAESSYSASQKSQLTKEADHMRDAIESDLTTSTPVQKGSASRKSVLYSNKRYFIPFGWWANDIPATASTGWAVFVDSNYNPFLLTGAYSSSYSPSPAPAPSPSSAACSAHSGCAGLSGNCCPTDDGTMLSCC